MTTPIDGGVQPGEGPRRYLIAVAVSRYPKCAAWNRPGLVQARDQIIELFTEQLGYQHHTALGLDPTAQQLREQLRAFCTSDDRREDDLVVVYLSGHGEILEDGSEHVLLMADTDPADVPFTSLPTADLVRVFRGTRVRRLLLILDTCYSGQGGNELAAAALERLGTQTAQSATSTGLVIVSSAQPHQQAQAGLFPHLFVQAVNSQATAGHAPTHLSVSTVVQQMNDHDDKPGYQHISLSLLGLAGEPPDFLTNPRHDVRLTDVDLALQGAAEFDAYALQRETEFTSRLLIRAMGYHGDTAHGWWFCGRHRALAELAAWLNQHGDHTQEGHIPRVVGASGSVRVVTAGPGSGKTAVLGLVAALTMPERRRTVPVDALGLHPEWIPGENAIDVVLYAQNLTDSQVLSGLAAAAGFRCATVGEFLEALERRYDKGGRPFTVLIDALDEAATPGSLCSQIVRPLIEHSRGRIRLLLGTRPYLLDRLGVGSRSAHRDGMVIDLDSPQYADPEALLAYTVRNLLQSRSTSPYRNHPEVLAPVARAVAAAAGTSFLVARFASFTLASADTVVTDPRNPRWRASLPRHAGQAMRDDLTRRLGPDAQRAADLLRPLAYAEGQGLPWEDIWAPLASAISGRTYTDEDLLWLRHSAGSYVVEATESGRSAYRLYHQALTEHLREDADATAVHAAFVDVLTDCVPYRGDATRDWSRAHPYTLHHLATHAAAAGRIDQILNISEYLVHAVPHGLAPHLQDASSTQARLTAAVYRTSFDLHATAPPPIRRHLLALNAARAEATTLLEGLNGYAQPDEWVPVWATGNDFTRALRHTFTGHDGPVRAVACTVLAGRPIAITGTYGSLHMWDVATGRQVGEPLTGLDGMVLAMACTVLDGHPVAVVGTGGLSGLSGSVTVWDVATGRQIGNPLTGLDGPVRAVACTVLDGRLVAVAGTGPNSRNGSVYVWDVATGRQTGNPLTGLDGPVCALTCTVLDGRPVAVAGTGPNSRNGSVYVWDVATGRQTGNPLTGPGGPVYAVACTVLDGRPVAVTGGLNGSVYVWDVATGRQIGNPPTGLDGPVHTVACTVLDDRPVAVTASMDRGGSAYVWDVATGRPIGKPLIGPSNPVYAAACTVLDGRPIVLTCDEGGTARLWELSEHVATSEPRTVSGSGRIFALTSAVLDGHPIAITGTDGRERSVYVWDVATGRQIGKPPTRRELCDPAFAVACTVLDDHPIAVIIAGAYLTNGEVSGEMHVWDLAEGRHVCEPRTVLLGASFTVTCAVLDGRPVAVAAAVGSERSVYVWDVATGRPIGEPLTGPSDPVLAVACTVLNGRTIAFTGTGNLSGNLPGIVYVWDVATGRLIGEPFTGFDSSVSAVACAVLDGRPVAVVGTRGSRFSGGSGGSVYVWDVATGRQIGNPLTGLDGPVHAVACTIIDGRPIAVIGSGKYLRVWDIRTRTPLQNFVVPGLHAVGTAHDGSLVAVLGRDIAVFQRQSHQRKASPDLQW
ncbi:caspase family protein [Streptomyces sp. NPDC047043]|uniref:caspase family protein n=1 Tax=Streptomyces sp. NPDC047043 TaxID=3154497 RepID=UPI0033DCC06A